MPFEQVVLISLLIGVQITLGIVAARHATPISHFARVGLFLLSALCFGGATLMAFQVLAWTFYYLVR